MKTLRAAMTPLERAEQVSRALGCDVYVKRDDLTHPVYGGNKIRKLELLLEHARARKATDLLTLGAVGSHHVLATAVHGRSAGFAVGAVVVPQPGSAHVEQTARADLAQGARLLPASNAASAAFAIAREALRLRAQGRRPYLIPTGGSTPLGAAGYVRAVRELAAQLEGGVLPAWPDVIVCALGSGGTYAGILAGVRALRAPSAVLGVRVTERWPLTRATLAWMANAALAQVEPSHTTNVPARINARDVHVIEDQIGRGYGEATAAGREAEELFARDGIVLDSTYTAKAAAGLIALARAPGGARRSYLFWHTFSSAPIEALLGTSPPELPREIRALMR